MQVKALQSQQITVSLSKESIDLVLRSKLLELIELQRFRFDDRNSGVYLDDDVVMEWHEHSGGSHSWTEKTKIRNATELDKVVFRVMSELKL